MSGNTCHIQFRIRYRVSRYDHCLAVLGNVSILGEWKPHRSVKAIPVGEDEWVVSISTPRDSTFQWKWVVVNTDNMIVKWEDRKDRLSIIKHSGALFCVWNQADEPEVLSISDNHLKISTTYNALPGHILVVVGSSSHLGMWKPERGIRAVETPSGSGLWVVEVALDRYRLVEWKWVVADSDFRAVRWEESGNRVILPEDDRRQVFAQWNGEEMTVLPPNSVETAGDIMLMSSAVVTGLGRSRFFEDRGQNSSREDKNTERTQNKTAYVPHRNISQEIPVPSTLNQIRPRPSQCDPVQTYVTADSRRETHVTAGSEEQTPVAASSRDETEVTADPEEQTNNEGQKPSHLEVPARRCHSRRRYFRSLDNPELSPLKTVLGIFYDLAALPFRISSDLCSAIFVPIWQQIPRFARDSDARM